jgi:S1-C subfamily serine protease
MPGSSGGPIVDLRGNVLGITSFGLNWHGQKLEFCISARDILDVVSQLDAKATPLHELPQLAPRNLLRPHNPWDGFPYKDLPSLPDPPPGPLAIQ